MRRHTAPDGADRVHTLELAGGDQPLTATKLVSMGELLLLERGPNQLRLDAMLLEGLSWQADAATLAEFVPTPELVVDDPDSAYGASPTEAADGFTVANEYTTVEVGRVDTGTGAALQIASGKGVAVLGAPTLDALLAVEDTGTFSRWFHTPIGPEPPL